MKIRTTNNGHGPSSVTSYDYWRLKHSYVTDLFVPPGKGKWMVIVNVGNGPSLRFYRNTRAEAEVLAARWITCQHDRTPQPKFNANDTQVDWWKPTYEAEQLRWAISQVLARADQTSQDV